MNHFWTHILYFYACFICNAVRQYICYFFLFTMIKNILLSIFPSDSLFLPLSSSHSLSFPPSVCLYLHPSLSLFLPPSTDESASENILKAEESYANMCGHLDMGTPRDAFITALCKASLPPHYTLTVLNTQASQQGKASLSRANSGGGEGPQDMVERSQVGLCKKNKKNPISRISINENFIDRIFD